MAMQKPDTAQLSVTHDNDTEMKDMSMSTSSTIEHHLPNTEQKPLSSIPLSSIPSSSTINELIHTDNSNNQSETRRSSMTLPIPTTFDDFINTSLTMEEKRKLRLDLLSLPPNKLAAVICVLQKAQPQNIKKRGDELQIDLKELSTRTLRHLQHHVQYLFETMQQNNVMFAPTPMFMQPTRMISSNNEQHFISNVNEPTTRRLCKPFRPRRRRKDILEKNMRDISDADKQEMRNVCDMLAVEQGVNISTDLYGFDQHVDVYRTILDIVNETNDNERNNMIEDLGTNKMRDIKTKLCLWGRVGRKAEMIQGFREKIPILVDAHNKYQADAADQ
eukprot:73784_1